MYKQNEVGTILINSTVKATGQILNLKANAPNLKLQLIISIFSIYFITDLVILTIHCHGYLQFDFIVSDAECQIYGEESAVYNLLCEHNLLDNILFFHFISILDASLYLIYIWFSFLDNKLYMPMYVKLQINHLRYKSGQIWARLCTSVAAKHQLQIIIYYYYYYYYYYHYYYRYMI